MIATDQLQGQIVFAGFCIGAAWMILFSVRVLFCAPYALLQAARKRLMTYELDIAQLEILAFRNELSEIGKLFLDFHIKNRSKPTTLKNWELSVIGSSLDVRGLTPERPLFNNKLQNRDGVFIGENLTEDPLQPYAEKYGQFICAFRGQQIEKFSQPGLSFELTVEDIFGRKITARHCT